MKPIDFELERTIRAQIDSRQAATTPLQIRPD